MAIQHWSEHSCFADELCGRWSAVRSDSRGRRRDQFLAPSLRDCYRMMHGRILHAAQNIQGSNRAGAGGRRGTRHLVREIRAIASCGARPRADYCRDSRVSAGISGCFDAGTGDRLAQQRRSFSSRRIHRLAGDPSGKFSQNAAGATGAENRNRELPSARRGCC